MGGFHGGHGGGVPGGFHGGGPHGGHRHHHYYHGYYAYGECCYNAPVNFETTLIVGFLLLFIGMLMFVLLFRFSCDATVTSTSRAYSASYKAYEKYDFTYEAYGNTYTGHGNDDYIITYETETTTSVYGSIVGKIVTAPNYEEQVKVGETYTVYVRLINPSDYDFDGSDNVYAYFGAIAGIIGIIFVIVGFVEIRAYKRELKKLGDYNGDGKINSKDYEDYMNGVPEGYVKTALEAQKPVKCPYCGADIIAGDMFCDSCGKKLYNK